MLRRIVLLALMMMIGFSPLVEAMGEEGDGSGVGASATSPTAATPSKTTDSTPPLYQPVIDLGKAFFSKENAGRSLGQTVAAWTAIAFLILLVHEQKVKAAGMHVEQVKEWVQIFLAGQMASDGARINKESLLRRVGDAMKAVDKVKSSGIASGVTIPLFFGLFSIAAGLFAWKFEELGTSKLRYTGAVVGAFATLILSIIAGVRGGRVSDASKGLRSLHDAIRAHQPGMISYGGPSPSQARITSALGRIGVVGDNGSTVAMNIVAVLGGGAMTAAQLKWARA